MSSKFHSTREASPLRCKVSAEVSTLAFTIVELLLVIAIIGVLAGVGVGLTRKTKVAAKESGCVANLKTLAGGMAIYQKNSDDRLPVGSVYFTDSKHISWDTQLMPFIRASLRTDLSKPAPGGSEVNKLALCPDDTIPGVSWGKTQAKRRTYSMPNHDMRENNWPPHAESTTGVGTHWSRSAKGNDSLTNFMAYSNKVPAIRAAMILAPDDTMLLTEHAYFRNILGNSSGAIIKTGFEHIKNAPEATGSLESLHSGRFNYLMVDGHVETLLPDQTVGLTGSVSSNGNTHKGIWTIKAGD